MTGHKKKVDEGRSVRLFLIGLVGLGLVLFVLLRDADIALLNPKGLIAAEERDLLYLTTAVLMLIAVPTMFLFYFFAWKYRESNEKAAYDPHTRHGKLFMFSIWAIPSVFMLVLAPILWSSTHRLAPQKAIAPDTKPLAIQVVAMRWKWLFIYPEQNIATVNFVQIPTGTPVQFELTADEVSMSSFWIPHLSGQLYAMTGHVNRLNMMAGTPGDYPGSSAEINGAGFAGMKFIARASSLETYDSWVQDVQANSGVLDSAGYEELLRPSENNRVAFYNLADKDLYDKVVMKYTEPDNSNNQKSDDRKTDHE